MERGETEKTHGKRFRMICQKVSSLSQLKLSVYPWRFYEDDKTLKRRFRTSSLF